MKTHKAILIDTTKFEVREVELEQDNIEQIYQHLKASTFDCVGLANGDAVYVDDEGLLNGTDRFFAVVGQTAILAGNALIMGTGDEGESIDPNTNIDEMQVAFFVKGADGWLHHVDPVAHHKSPEPGFTITEFPI
jgi:hypothetical protein